MNLMLILGCAEYHVLMYEICRIHPSEFGRDYGVHDCLYHWRKTAKIGNGWRTFRQSKNLQART